MNIWTVTEYCPADMLCTVYSLVEFVQLFRKYNVDVALVLFLQQFVNDFSQVVFTLLVKS